jgi:hypothetical protein
MRSQKRKGRSGVVITCDHIATIGPDTTPVSKFDIPDAEKKVKRLFLSKN